MSIQASNGQMLPDREGGSTVLHLDLQSLHDLEFSPTNYFCDLQKCPFPLILSSNSPGYTVPLCQRLQRFHLESLRFNFTDNSAEEN